jgi:hypothetical protein
MSHVTGNTMTMAHFHDFYYLETLQAHMNMAKFANGELQFRRAFLKLENDVNEELARFSKAMAARIHVYLWAAALGEARHASSMCETHIVELDGYGRDSVYNKSTRFMPYGENQNILREIFAQDWEEGYGGEAWLSIVDGMMMYGNVPDAAFIDHAVDLEHNGGNVFTKGCDDAVQCFGTYSYSRLRPFLNYKFAADILNETPCYTDTLAITRKTFTLVTRFSNIVRKVNAVNFLSPELENLTDFSVTWGNDELTTDTSERDHCYKCGEAMDSDYAQYSEITDEHYCSYCYNELFVHCGKCNQELEQDDAIDCTHHHKYYHLCEECANEEMSQCNECDEWHENYAVTEDESEVYCEKCQDKYKCETCGDFYSDLETHVTDEHGESEKDSPIQLELGI